MQVRPNRLRMCLGVGFEFARAFFSTLPRIPGWYWTAIAISLLANILASVASWITAGVMGSETPFAMAVAERTALYLRWFRAVVYPAMAWILSAYMWPVVTYFRDTDGAKVCWRDDAVFPEASDLVRRRAVGAPLAVAACGFSGWILGPLFFASLTLGEFGTWSTELMSQQVLSPLVSGFFAAVVTYLLLDALFRRRVYPFVFPKGGLAEVPTAIRLGVRGRLLALLFAVAFLPLFTMLGLVRAAAVRLENGADPIETLGRLDSAAEGTFFAYVLLGLLLALVEARLLTAPLQEAVAALRAIRRGDLEARVPVASVDESGALGDGVNELAGTLRERSHILATFGGVVEPSVRDRLLRGEQDTASLQTVSILLCDIRGFTTLSESSSPSEAVALLNEFYDAAACTVRESSGVVDKFLGDALLAVFGLFDETDDGAVAALNTAGRIPQALQEMNSRREAAGMDPVEVRTVVHTGPVVAGRIGSSERFDFTVIGDTVNVASLLEGVAKARGALLVVSEVAVEAALTRAATGETLLDPGLMERESVQLRGRSEPVAVRYLRDAVEAPALQEDSSPAA